MQNNLSTKKKVLITGANGFIGLNVIKLFASDNVFEIVALVHNNISDELKTIENIKIIKGDVCDKNIIEELNKTVVFDIVIHIAGLAKDIGCDEKFRKLNFESVKHMASCAKEKFIYISTTDVYGIKDFNNADEATSYHNYPNNPYPKYKIKAEKRIKQNCHNYIIVRPAAVFGKNDKTIEKRVVDFLKDSPFIVHFGKHKGQNRWPLADVENIAKVLLYVSKYNDYNNQAINIIDSKRTTIEEYYRQIAKKYFPNKKFKTICLPLFVGKIIGFVSTILSNMFKLNNPIFDPTYYAVHHISSNLDFSNKKMEMIIEKFNTLQTKQKNTMINLKY